jgi:YidC/Oxa1 family membrane protein insertase
MLSFFWNEYLYRPVFNVLIYFYNEVAHRNMGLAVIYLTLLLRVILLPFSVVSVWKQGFYAKLSHDIRKIADTFKNDQVLQKQEIREYLKTHRVNPWSKAIVLGVQAVTLLLLYQVFIGGISGEKFYVLYPSVERPDFVNTKFLGFDLGGHDFFWPTIVALFLFFEISWEHKKKTGVLMNSDVVYKFVFPFFVFITLYILPMVKSLFILTSLVFSFIVVGGIDALFNILHKGPEWEAETEDDD